jgi:eukaryotic-like serine/threonine-protein kinase
VIPIPPEANRRVIGRYAIYGEIAAGGMATVHLGRLLGEAGFSRTVAIKRLHEQFAKDPDFVSMFLDEARTASRVRHPNVVSILDVVVLGREIFLVMDYVQGESLSRLARTARSSQKRIPPKIALSMMVGALHGLHAAHEAKSESGGSLGIVHRDVSPQNILVDVDGVARVIDFGVAKAAGRLQTTREGTLKGKLQYMPPEQIQGDDIDRRSDIYAAAVVLWELLANQRMFKGKQDVSLMHEILDKVLNNKIEPPSQFSPGLPKSLDDIVLKGLAATPEARWETARDMAVAIEKALVVSSTREVGDWVHSVAGEVLKEKSQRLAEIESISTLSVRPELRSATDLLTAVQTPGAIANQDLASGVYSDVTSSLISSPSLVTSNSVVSSPSGVAPLAPAPLPAQPSSGRNVVIISVGVAVGIIGLGIIGMFTILRGSATAMDATPNEGSATSVPTVVPTEEPPTFNIDDLAKVEEQDADVADADEELADATAKVADTAVAATATAPPTKRPGGYKPPVVPTKTATAKPPPAANCDPPYTIDSSGIKRFKPECLR